MSIRANALIGLSLSVLTATASFAASVPVFNTGVDGTGAVLPVGSVDTHYTVGSNGAAYVYNNGAYTQLNDAIFISASANGEMAAGTTSTYSTTFDLTGYNALSAKLSGSFGADDAGKVFLNGALIGTSNAADPQYRNLTSFAATSGFLSGVNTLTFSIFNNGGPTGVIVTGLMVDAIAAPGPIAGAGIPALIMLGGVLFARRRKAITA